MAPENTAALFMAQLDDEPPFMRDAAELGCDVRRSAEDRHYGWGCVHELRVWRWLGDGQLEPLTVRCIYRGDYDEQDYLYPVWAVTGPDGAEHVSVCVRIDGRA